MDYVEDRTVYGSLVICKLTAINNLIGLINLMKIFDPNYNLIFG